MNVHDIMIASTEELKSRKKTIKRYISEYEEEIDKISLELKRRKQDYSCC